LNNILFKGLSLNDKPSDIFSGDLIDELVEHFVQDDELTRERVHQLFTPITIVQEKIKVVEKVVEKPVPTPVYVEKPRPSTRDQG
jgi:hypothetical protein